MTVDVYENCPIYENEYYMLRMTNKEDKADLLKLYSDEKSVPFFNSDNCGVDINAIENSNDMKNAAEKLTKIVKKADTGKTTDQSGKVTFGELSVGVYLISAEDSASYDTVEPALIAVPTWSDTEGNMMYDVTIEPKHTPKPEKEKNKVPQTGLEDNTWKYAGIAGICVIGAAGFGVALTMNKRKK